MNKKELIRDPKAPYGTKADGSPRSKPGRKLGGVSSMTKTFYVTHDGKGGWTPCSKGKPSLETLMVRRQITIPKSEKYDFSVHGNGIRLPQDDDRASALTKKGASRREQTVIVNVESLKPAIEEESEDQEVLNEELVSA